MHMKFLISIIVLIASLIVILLFITKLKPEESIDKTTCRASVDARHIFNINILSEQGRENIPLNCKTEKICISKSGENCDALGFLPSKNNDVGKKKIGVLIDTSTKQVVLETIAEKLYDCHYIMGEGKKNFLPHDFSEENNYCLICSRITLDKEARKEAGEISYIELYQFLQQKKTSKGISYLEYIYNKKTVSEMIPILKSLMETINDENGEGTVKSIDDFKLNLEYQHGNAIIAQQTAESTMNEWLGAGGIAGGTIVILGSIAAAPFTGGLSLTPLIVGAVAIGTGSITYNVDLGGTIIGDKNKILLGSGPILISKTPHEESYAHPTLYSYNSEVLKSLGCTEFELAPS